MAVNTRPDRDVTLYSLEHILNQSFDRLSQMLAFQSVGFDGTTNLQREIAGNTQIYAVYDGTYNYFCFAAVGTPQADANWMIFRLDEIGNKVYADGDAEFDNVATNPALLTYSYS